MASSSATETTDAELDKLLNQEATALQRDLEVRTDFSHHFCHNSHSIQVERILTAFKLNPYDILDLEVDVTPDGIKKKYKQISLCELQCY